MSSTAVACATLGTAVLLAISCSTTERPFNSDLGEAEAGASPGGAGPQALGGAGRGGLGSAASAAAAGAEPEGGAAGTAPDDDPVPGLAGAGGQDGSECPTGQASCGDSCVDVLSADAHCGASCQKCSGSTPRCASGVCSECLTAKDCPAVGSACTPSHACECRPPSSTNELLQPGFASVPELQTWAPSPGATWTSDDADSCQGSGAVKLEYLVPPVFDFGHITRCVSAAPSQKYYFGMRYKQTENSSLYCLLSFYASDDCSGTSLSAPTGEALEFPVHGFWASTTSNQTSPAGTGSIDVMCQTNGPGPDYIDQIYLNAASDAF